MKRPSLMWRKASYIILFGLLLTAACKKDDPNPFDDPSTKPPEDTTSTTQLDPTSFAGLHKQIFKATCANSGCHDGTFEPDFRTIEGAYNTLVYHPIIKNNPFGDFEFRVLPGNYLESVIYERLTNDIDGISGIMPLETDPGSDWPDKKEEYINNIKIWIQNGAPDMFGVMPTMGNREPQMLGVVAFADGNTTPLPRNTGNGSILVPSATNSLEIWVSISDDSTATPSLAFNKIKLSLSRDNFSLSPENNLNIAGTPITEDGYFGDPVQYYHNYIVANPVTFGPPGTVVYFRVYVQDPQHDVTEIPELGSFNYIKDYFSFEIEL